MQHKRISSAMMLSAGWENGIMEIKFNNGSIFSYECPESVYAGLKNAYSPGKYFAQNIKGKYNGRKEEYGGLSDVQPRGFPERQPPDTSNDDEFFGLL